MDKITWIHAWPLSTYYAAYIDHKKSLPHRNEKGLLENVAGYPYWIPEQRYVANLQDYLDLIADMKLDEFVINDPLTKKPLVKFYVEKGRKAIFDGEIGNGMIDFQYTPELTGYRKRESGILGLESLSRFDTRLSKREFTKNPDKFPKNILVTTDEEANFSNLTGFDKIIERAKKEREKKEKEEKKARDQVKLESAQKAKK